MEPDFLPFNSREERYKSIPTAVPGGQGVLLRICLPRNLGCTAAYLVIQKDGCPERRQGMFWAGMEGDAHEWWDTTMTLCDPGLYFYSFELSTPWGTPQILNKGQGVGMLCNDGEKFQQTVYDPAFTTPDWFKGGLIYQIFPDRFAFSGQAKKDVPTDRVLRNDWGNEPYWRPTSDGKVLNNDYFGGDLKGIEKKLPYLASLGVTCIYLNPIFEAHSNHRYDTADYTNIDLLLGDEKDFTALCKAAKKHGISVILDGVFSHTGCDSLYFNKNKRYPMNGAYNTKESPYYSWYKFIRWPEEYHSWWGIDLLPEVMEEDKNFEAFICGENGVLRRWLKAGAAGWRLDVADELPDCFLDALRQAVKAENPQAIILGEVWEDATTKFSYGVRRRYLQGQQLDSVMNYPFAEAVLRFARYGNAAAFFDTVHTILENYPPQVVNVLMNHIGTHDTERALTRLGGEPCDGRDRSWQSGRTLTAEQRKFGKQLLKIASLLQYTIPGVPSLYYGDEAGMEGYRDPFNRSCYPWGKEDHDLIQWYQRLGRLRREIRALRDGTFRRLYSDGDVLAYCREMEQSGLLVAVNRGAVEYTLPIPEVWRYATPLLGAVPNHDTLRLPPYGYAALGR